MASVGTAHFKDLEAALRYYRPYGSDMEDIHAKLKEGAIHLGPPEKLQPGETCLLNHEGRYVIKEPPFMHYHIKTIIEQGFKVYMRKRTDSWLYFVEGDKIGYLENNRLQGFTLTTVHIPNKDSGTGYAIGPTGGMLDADTLRRAFVIRPHWATGPTPTKWKNIEALIKSSMFAGEYHLIEA